MRLRAGGVLLVGAACLVVFGPLPLPQVYPAAVAIWLCCLGGGRSTPLSWVLGIALLMRLPFFFTEFFSDDLHRYVWEGRIQWEGFSPYVHAPGDAALAHLRTPELHPKISHPELTTIYPPLSQLLFVLGAGAGLGPLGFKNLILALDCAVVVALVGWMRATGRRPASAVLYAWAPLAVTAAAAGHVDPLLLLPLVGFAWAWETGRYKSAAALLAFAILAKTVAILLVPWALLRRPKAVLFVLCPVVALGYLPYLLHGDVIGSLFEFGRDFAFNGSIFRLLDGSLPAGWARPAVASLLVAWVGIVTLFQPRIARAVALVFAGLLACSPTVQHWYLTWFLVMLPGVGSLRWCAPLVAWAASAMLAMRTYWILHTGGEFAEDLRLTWMEYAIPALVLLWVLIRSWPRRLPLATGGCGAPGSFSVVIPAYREAKNLKALLPRWSRTPVLKVLVADTPTDDGTEDVVRFADRAHYVAARERGYGAAVAAGIAAVRKSEYVVICDADHDLGPDQVEALLAPFSDPAVGLVCGARGGSRGLSLPQRFGNWLATSLIAVGWGRRFHDLGPFRAIRLRALPLSFLRERGFGWNVEMNVRALERGVGIVEVALPPGRRTHGRNRISATLRGVFGAGFGILRQIYRMREESCRPASSS